jgi:N-acetylglucosamine-6-sulfatase
VLTNAYPQGGVEKLVDAHTLPVWLKAAGYRTGFVGKYLNGYGWAGIPPDGTTPRHPALDARYVPPGWDDWQGLVDPSTYQVFNYKLNDNGTVVTYGDTPEEYQTDVLAQRARDFIHEAEALDDAKPFFLTVTPLAPHVEVFNYSPSSYADVWRWFIRPDPKDYTEKSQAMNTIGNIPLWPALKPSFNEDNLTDKPQWVQEHRPVMTSEDISYLTRQYRSRLASMLAVDDLIGAVVQALSANGELENTVLIFTSDNGFMYGEHRMAEKLALYEESIRVPLYIRAPGMTGPSQVDALVLNNDLAPTIASLAGATAEGLVMDGRSLREFLEGQTPSSWRKRFLVEHWPSSSSELDLPAYVAVRSGPTATHVPEMVWAEYRYYGTPFAWEQYDLRTDPLQMNSLHADTSEARQAQRATLDYWLRHLQDCANGSCQFYESL